MSKILSKAQIHCYRDVVGCRTLDMMELATLLTSHEELRELAMRAVEYMNNSESPAMRNCASEIGESLE